jgi:hypothetical protein
MYKIVIKGEAYTDYQDKSFFNGLDCQDEFSEYFDRVDEKALIEKGVTDGYMSFKYDEELNKLFTITEYSSKEKLTSEELNILGEYTQGQWSDGIGEGFEQEPQYSDDDEEIYVSPWFDGQQIEIIQS